MACDGRDASHFAAILIMAGCDIVDDHRDWLIPAVCEDLRAGRGHRAVLNFPSPAVFGGAIFKNISTFLIRPTGILTGFLSLERAAEQCVTGAGCATCADVLSAVRALCGSAFVTWILYLVLQQALTCGSWFADLLGRVRYMWR